MLPPDQADDVTYDVPKKARPHLPEVLRANGIVDVQLVQHAMGGAAPSHGTHVTAAIVVVADESLSVFPTKPVTKNIAVPPLWSCSLADITACSVPGPLGKITVTVDDIRSITLRVGSAAAAQRIIGTFPDTVTDGTAVAPAAGRTADQSGWLRVAVVAAHGYPLTQGTALLLGRDPERFLLRTFDGQPLGHISYDRITSAETGGPGTVTSGGGFIGGGFGVDGMLVGIAAASLLNKATTRTQVQTLLRIATFDGEVTLFTDQITPDVLDAQLGPVRHAINLRNNPPPTPAVPDQAAPPVSATASGLSDELAKLADLHSAGVLTDDEFAAAKQRLLSS